MHRAKTMLLVAFGLMVFGTPCVLATTSTLVVGTCRPKMPTYTSIGAAVAAAPSGATVLVCPGSYAEQLVISTPLTLEGISNGSADRAVITVPSGGLSPSFTPLGAGSPSAVQVLVTTGPVNISNITVDGTGNGVSLEGLAGIAYEGGSSGTVNGVTVRNETESSSGIGIYAENGTTLGESVTVENSSVHDFDGGGIVAVTNQSPPTLIVTIKGNEVTTPASFFTEGIDANGTNGSISGNNVSGGFYGIFQSGGSPMSITGNTVTAVVIGISVFDGDVVKANVVLNTSQTAIVLSSPVAPTVESNVIGNSAAGIEFGCQPATVSGNTIRDTTTALKDVPLSFSLLSNTYQNVDAIRSGGVCTAARTKALAAAAADAAAKVLQRLGVH